MDADSHEVNGNRCAVCGCVPSLVVAEVCAVWGLRSRLGQRPTAQRSGLEGGPHTVEHNVRRRRGCGLGDVQRVVGDPYATGAMRSA